MIQCNGVSRACTLDTQQVQGNRLSLFRRVHHLHDDLTRRLVKDRGGKETILSLLSCNGLATHGQRQHVGALVHGKHLLHIVAHRLERTQVVVPDGIGTPLPALHMGKERSVGSHVHDVSIALNTRHVGSLVKRCLKMVPLLAASVAGILAGKHLGTLAVIGVVAQSVA